MLSSASILKEWFPEKEYVQVLAITKNITSPEGKNNLEYRDIILYSYISYRTKNNEITLKKKLADKFCYDWDSIKSSLKRLESFNLIKQDSSGWSEALEPAGKTKEWFAYHKEIDKYEHWFDKITYYRMYLTDPSVKRKEENMKDGKRYNKSILSFKDNALFWILCSISKPGDKKDFLIKEYQKKSGLAAMALMSERGVSNSLKRLEELKLIEQIGNKYIIRQPSSEQIKYWKTLKTVSKEQQNETNKSQLILSQDLKYKLGGPIDEGFLRQVDNIGKKLVLKYGCGDDYQTIREIFQYVLDHYPRWNIASITTFIYFTFDDIIDEAYRENTYSCSCAKLLEHKVKRIIDLMNKC